MSTPDNSSLATRIPFVFGIVGHRDPRPDDEPALRQALRSIIEEFRAAYPNTPLVVLSALAEGADILAAEVALEMTCEVRAPLPFKAEIYPQSTSFDTDQGRTRLQALLADERVIRFPVGEAANPASADQDVWKEVASNKKDAEYIRRRRECYAAAGGYIARHCHVLVAFWDGAGPNPERPSGTAEHIFFKLLGRPPKHFCEAKLSPLGFHGESGPVVVVHTPRKQGSDAPEQTAGNVQMLLPAGPKRYCVAPRGVPLPRRHSPLKRFLTRCGQAMGGSLLEDDHHSHAPPAGEGQWQVEFSRAIVDELQQTYQTLDDFNKDVRREAPPYWQDDLSKAPLSAAAPAFLKTSLESMHRTRRVAADLSSGLQIPLEGDEAGTFGLLFVASVAFDLYAHMFCIVQGQTQHLPWLLMLFAGAIALAVLIVVRSWWIRNEARRLDYRALAEALRVRVAWGLAGIGRSVADSYLSQLRSEMSWTRTALLHISPPPTLWSQEFESLPLAEQHARLVHVRTAWVIEQRKHFVKSHDREHHKARMYRRMGFGLAILAVILTLSIFVVPYPHGHWPWCPAEPAHHGHSTATSPAHWVVLAAGITALMAGFAVAYSERRAFESLAAQYDRMSTVFENAEVEIDRHLASNDYQSVQAALEELGHEAITEHAQWLIARRARPFELHIGG